MAKLQQEFHEKMSTTHYAINTEISEQISTRFKKMARLTRPNPQSFLRAVFNALVKRFANNTM